MLDLLPPGPLPVATSASETASSQGALGTELAVLASLSCKCCWPLPDVRGPVTNFMLFCFSFFKFVCVPQWEMNICSLYKMWENRAEQKEEILNEKLPF